MIINASTLKSFVKKASLNGRIMSINLNFTEEGLKSSVRDFPNIALTLTELKKEAFEEYNQIGEIFIKNADMFLKYLDTFSENVGLEKIEEHILRLANDCREVYVILGSALVCENVFRDKRPEVPTTATATIANKDLARTLADMSLLKINKVTLSQDKHDFNLEVGEKKETDYFLNNLKVEGEGKGKTSIGDMFIAFYESLNSSGKITINIGDDLPVVLNETSEFIDFTCLIAPMTDN